MPILVHYSDVIQRREHIDNGDFWTVNITFWQTGFQVITVLDIAIEMQQMRMRQDPDFRKDVGVKKKLISLLLCYNPLW